MKVLSEISVVSTLQDYQKFCRADPYSAHPRKVRSIEKIEKIARENGYDVLPLKELLEIPPSSGRGGLSVIPNGEVKIVKPANLTNLFFVDLTNCGGTTLEAYNSSEKGRLQNLDILVLSAAHAEGYIGTNTSIVHLDNDEKAICIGELIRLRPNIDKINPYYLTLYLNSIIGKHMLNYSVRGQTVHLYPKDIEYLPILLPPREIQDSIGNKLKQAIEAKIEAEKKRREVEEIFERNLGKIEIKKLGGYVFKLSQCLVAGRLDPHFYYPEFLKVLNILNNSDFEIKKLSELVEFSKETINPSNILQFVYVEIADVDLRYGFISSHSIVKGSNAPSRARKVIRKGALLIPLTRPYRGAIAIVDSRYDGAITTTGFSVSYPKLNSGIDSYYLCAFLKSPYGLIQLTQRMGNANYPAILEKDIANILVPILSNDDIKTISGNMQKIINNLLLSKQLRSQAMEELNKLLCLNDGGDKS
ncbi:restriction endonuclease subunit S [Archaeoglobus sp.]